MIVLVVWQGRTILALFSSDAEVLDIAYVRVCMLFPAYVFSMAYENMSGYLRGFGISALPSALTAIGVCGTRFFWALAVFPVHPTFATVMVAYPVSFWHHGTAHRRCTCLLQARATSHAPQDRHVVTPNGRPFTSESRPRRFFRSSLLRIPSDLRKG